MKSIRIMYKYFKKGIILVALVNLSCSDSINISEDNWVKLFNKENLDNWDIKIKGYPLNVNYGNTFRVKDNKLTINYEEYEGWENRYGHIFSKEKFSSYLLVVEYRFIGDQIEEGPSWAFRNNGLMLHSQSAASMKIEQDFPISLEVQLLGGNGSEDRPTANLCTPGTQVIINENLYKPHCYNSTSKTFHGDQWVKVEVLVLKDSLIKHIVEGDTVLVYENPQVDSDDNLFNSNLYKENQLIKDGHIALQSESHPTEFREIVLFNLEKYLNDPHKLGEALRKLQNRDKKNKNP